MKKVLIGLVIAVMMTGSVSLYSASLYYEDYKNEFTDDRRLLLALVADDKNLMFSISCSQGDNKLNFIATPELYFGTEDVANLKIRFDDKQMYEKKLNMFSNNEAAFTRDLPFILEFLDNLKISKNFILKFANDSTARFTEYLDRELNEVDAEERVNNFLENSLEMGCHKIEDIDPYE